MAEDPLAPTTIKDPWRIVDDHLADSLVALALPQLRASSRVVDLGSGAGFPGLPLAVALGQTSFTLVESSSRKCAFIERAAKEAEIPHAEVIHARAEAFREGLGAFDVATVRALASLDVVAEYAAPLLRVGGSLIAWRGRRDADAETAAARAAAALGLEIVETVPVQPYPASRNRHLTLMSKVTDTSPEFPRRPGAAAKSPLGARDRAHS